MERRKQGNKERERKPGILKLIQRQNIHRKEGTETNTI
jgi:hypothetical protein